MKWPILLQRKPTTIRAMRWTGDNYSDIRAWGAPVTFMGQARAGFDDEYQDHDLWLWVAANGVQMRLEMGEWIALDEIGYYPIKDQMVKKNYVEVDHE
jgi:hypothetical protein